ncbi:MAG: hypothetical protein AAGF25_11710 [Pseudomonadota bacterium]
MIQLANHFRDIERSRHSEWLHQRKWFIKAKHDQERREKIEEQAEDSFIALSSDVIIATEIQIREFQARMEAFEVKLDDYDAKLTILDEAVAEALLEQISKLELLEADKQAMLDSAFTLEDGRKVFRSEDSTFAVDETGNRLGQLEFEAQDIPAGPDTAEDYLKKLDDISATKSEIDQLHKAQQDIDAARDNSAEAREILKRGRDLAGTEGVSVGELDDLEKELEGAMPKHIPRIPTSAMKFVAGVKVSAVPEVKTNFAGAADGLAIPPEPLVPKAPSGLELDG